MSNYTWSPVYFNELEATGWLLGPRIISVRMFTRSPFPLQSFVSFVLVVGEKEKTSGTVNIRTRDNKVHGERTLSETIERLQQLKQSRSKQAEEEF